MRQKHLVYLPHLQKLLPKAWRPKTEKSRQYGTVMKATNTQLIHSTNSSSTIYMILRQVTNLP
jgi:hypothetical protein